PLSRSLADRTRAVELAAVPRHRGEVEAAVEQELRQLARPVGAEVEEDRGVVTGEPRLPCENDRFDELARHAALVARRDGRSRVVGVLALPLHDRVEGSLR